MINSNFGFTPLKEVWLGDCYPESFYDHLPNEIADPFRQITEWTRQDTAKLQTFLEERGIVVRRPKFESIDFYINDDDGCLRRPPITPRDDYLVLGTTLYSLREVPDRNPWQHWLDYYQSNLCDVQSGWNKPVDYIHPPSLVRMGKDLYIDQDIHQDFWPQCTQWMVDTARDYRVNIAATNGHSDAVFCPVAPGLIVSSHYKTNYQHTFPGWEVFPIPNTLNNFTFEKNWWTRDPDINNNQAFSQHIQSRAQDWVGEARETVFEVNMLVIDEKNVVVMKEYPPLNAWLHDRGITVHQIDFRTRSFWDGGWHCMTLDIRRDDTKADLFPERGDPGVAWRID